MFYDTEGIVWIAARNIGIVSYNPDSREFNQYRNYKGDESSLPQGFFKSIVKDTEGNKIGLYGN